MLGKPTLLVWSQADRLCMSHLLVWEPPWRSAVHSCLPTSGIRLCSAVGPHTRQIWALGSRQYPCGPAQVLPCEQTSPHWHHSPALHPLQYINSPMHSCVVPSAEYIGGHIVLYDNCILLPFCKQPLGPARALSLECRYCCLTHLL